MSVQTQIDRISGNVSAALSAIAGKGVTVPEGSNSDALAELIASIEAGGGSVTSVTDDGAGNITINALYSFTFTDDGNGNLTGSTVSGTSSTDDSGNVIFG